MEGALTNISNLPASRRHENSRHRLKQLMEEESHSEESSPSRRLLSEVEKAKDDLDDFFKSFEEEAVTPAFAHAQEHPAPVFDKRNGGSRQQQCSCSNDMDALIAQIERGWHRAVSSLINSRRYALRKGRVGCFAY